MSLLLSVRVEEGKEKEVKRGLSRTTVAFGVGALATGLCWAGQTLSLAMTTSQLVVHLQGKQHVELLLTKPEVHWISVIVSWLRDKRGAACDRMCFSASVFTRDIHLPLCPGCKFLYLDCKWNINSINMKMMVLHHHLCVTLWAAISVFHWRRVGNATFRGFIRTFIVNFLQSCGADAWVLWVLFIWRSGSGGISERTQIFLKSNEMQTDMKLFLIVN